MHHMMMHLPSFAPTLLPPPPHLYLNIPPEGRRVCRTKNVASYYQSVKNFNTSNQGELICVTQVRDISLTSSVVSRQVPCHE